MDSATYICYIRICSILSCHLLNIFCPDFLIPFSYLVPFIQFGSCIGTTVFAIGLVHVCVFFYKYTVFYCSPKQLDFSEYKLPEGVSSVVPSGVKPSFQRYLFDHCAQNIM